MKLADGYDKHRIIGEWRAIARPTGYDLLGNRNTVWDALNGVTHGYAHNLANEYNKATTGMVSQPCDAR